MNSQDVFAQRGAAARVFGGMTRLQNQPVAPDSVDSAYHGAGETIAGFAIAQKMNPSEAARRLVSAGTVSPSDPRAVALQEAPDAALVAKMTSAKGLNEVTRDLTKAGGELNMGREETAVLNGLKLGLKAQSLSPEKVAVAFERIVVSGDERAAQLATSAYVAATHLGVDQARTRKRERTKDDEQR
jgi:hypothetical protein